MEGYTIQLFWDSEAGVWLATSKDIQGLVLEADSLDEVIQKTLLAVPELIELNSLEKKSDIYFNYNRHERVALA